MSGSLITLIVFCSIALAVVIGICFTTYMTPRARGLALGIGALLLTVLGVVYFSVKPILNAPDEPPQRFVAYFENAGGIDMGDVVRIKGRRAGRVVGTEVVHRDGKVMIRVEFEIAPGSGSQWLKEGGIPSDSVIRVRQASIIGRPSLSITYGENEQPIAQGGEWKNAEGVSGEDRFESWLREIRKFDAAIDKYMGYVKPELIAEIKLGIAQLRLNIDKVRASVERGFEAAPEIVRGIDELSRAVARLNDEMRTNAPQISKNLESLNNQLKDAPEFTRKAQESIGKLSKDIAEISDTLAENATRAENGDLDKVLLEFRKFTAQLRGGAVRAEYNPKQAGDMPPWRLARPYFNGGKNALEAAEIAEKGGSSDYKELPAAPKPRPKPKTED
jgi:ABC-type transporter Mla subunit MlaD